MKITATQRQQGNTLMLTLFFCVIIGMVLASALKLIAGRYSMTVRSTEWNGTIPVLEAGIEEAMTHMHDDATPNANGWTPTTVNGVPVYAKQRTFADGSYFNTLIYSNGTSAPFIFSQGFVRSPLKANTYISRTVKVGLTNPPNVFTKALSTGSGGIAFSGGNVTIDSYSSALGAYNVTSNRSAFGNIATDSTNVPAISLSGGTVYGTVTTGPGGTVTGGTVGTNLSWTSGIEPGTTNNNMNVSFPSNSPPPNLASFLPLPPAGVTNTVVVPSGSYQMSSYSSGGPMIITGNVTLYDSGNFSIAGTDYIQLMPGATVTLYVGGSISMAGNGVINGTGFAGNFNVLGLSGCTGISYTGNAAFNGTVYAPSADVTIHGNGDIFGAIIAKSATLTGNATLHYPTELAKQGGMVATSWVEQ
jgi:hypothetical protein